MGFNDKRLGSKPKKIRRISLLKRFFAEKINDNINIKKYILYNVYSPLNKEKSKSYDGKIVKINEVFKEKAEDFNLMKEDSNGERRLFLSDFNPDMCDGQGNYIFISCPNMTINGTMSNLLIYVTIVVPYKFNELGEIGEERIYKIGEEVEDLFDQYTLEKKPNNVEDIENLIVEEVGNVTFELDRVTVTTARLTKSSDYIVLSMPFVVNVVGVKRG